MLSAVLFGAMPILARFAYADGVEPIALLAARFSLAGAVMVVLLRVRGERWPGGGVLLTLVALGAVGYVGQSFTYFTALTMIPAALVALLLYLYPAVVTVLSAVLLKERLTAARAGAVALALAGSALTIGRFGVSGARPLGIALAVAAALIYSCYILIGSRVAARAGALASSTVVICSAGVMCALIAAIQRPSFPSSAAGWAAIVAIALLCTVGAVIAFFVGLELIGASDSATLSTLEPAVSVVLAAIFLQEALTWNQLVGGLCIVLAVIVLARTGPRT